MFLTGGNVLDYLTARRFAAPDCVARGEYSVRNLSRRNSNFRVTCGAREFLVKQAGTWDRAGRASVEREADLCRRAATDPQFRPLRDLAPAVHSYDPANSILIFEFLPGDLALSADTARIAGETMAAWHAAMQAPELAEAFPGGLPGAFTIHRWNPERLDGKSDAQKELVRLVQRHAAFGPAIDRVAAEWRNRALIHGDWKLENCLITAGGTRLHVVDWELAGWGDPRWDAGTLLQSWWNRWVRDPERERLADLRPALRAFLAGYGEPAHNILPFAGVRMLQSAWEALQDLSEMQGDAVRLAQVSLHILTDPEWAQRELLGND